MYHGQALKVLQDKGLPDEQPEENGLAGGIAGVHCETGTVTFNTTAPAPLAGIPPRPANLKCPSLLR